MSVSSINPAYGSVASLWGMDISMSENDSGSQASGKTSGKTSAASGKSNTAYSSTAITSGTLSKALSGVMDGMGLKSTDKVSFQTLMDYRDKLQESFTDDVRKGLEKAGVAADAEFRLTSGPDGTGIRVVTDHADKEKIEQFFKDNPEFAERFEQMQSLNKLDEARKGRQIDVKAVRDRIQLESMTAWYSGNNSFMAFAGESASYYSGINTIA